MYQNEHHDWMQLFYCEIFSEAKVTKQDQKVTIDLFISFLTVQKQAQHSYIFAVFDNALV